MKGVCLAGGLSVSLSRAAPIFTACGHVHLDLPSAPKSSSEKQNSPCTGQIISSLDALLSVANVPSILEENRQGEQQGSTKGLQTGPHSALPKLPPAGLRLVSHRPGYQEQSLRRLWGDPELAISSEEKHPEDWQGGR